MADNVEDLHGAGRPQAPSLGLGERLRSARKARALSVSQVAEALHLEETSVVALEEGRFDAMGAPVFSGGDAGVGVLMGLSPEAVLEAYHAASPGSEAPPVIVRPRVHTESVRLGPWAWWLAGAAVLLVALIALVSGGGDDDAAAPAEAAPQTAEPQPAPAAEPIGEVPVALPASPDSAPPAAAAGATAPEPAPDAGTSPAAAASE